MLQLTSRRFLRELDEAPGGNNLQYILKCPCIPFFGNQGLHNEIMLGDNEGALQGHVWGVLLHLPPRQGCCVSKQWFRNWKWRWSQSGGCVLGQLDASDSTPQRGPVPWHQRLPPKSCVLCWNPSTWPGTGTSSGTSDYLISLPLPTLLLRWRWWMAAGLAVSSLGSDLLERRTTLRCWILGATASFCEITWDGRLTVPLGFLFRRVLVGDVTTSETDVSF